MKTSNKAALLSFLVFPGVGHLYLKHYPSGLCLLLAAAAAFYYVVSHAVATALAVVDQVRSGAISPDITSMTTLMSQQTAGQEQTLNLVSLVLVVLWGISIATAYRLGQARDKERAKTG